MAFDGTDKDWCAAIPMNQSWDQRMRIAQFGDGYAQRTLDGINSMRRRWQPRFELKTEPVIRSMVAYLDGRKGNAFPFQDPATLVVYQVTCDEWQVDWLQVKFTPAGTRKELRGTLTAEFIQNYGVTA
ncbi:phage tail protein [Sinorhizobium fredii]|uniref:phage tail protein n=1 Tax=Rhizobium fredii TaxID=380 RepID=UPI0004B54CED|nr:phage tail protein [Sinorhizobium fredii]